MGNIHGDKGEKFMDLQQFAQALNEFDNVLITDDKGCAIFYDLPDLNILMEIGLTPDEFFHSTVTDNYQNLSPETSSVFKVLQSAFLHRVLKAENPKKSTFGMEEIGVEK